MSYSRFMSFNVIGGIGWVAIMVWAGYWFGNIPFVQRNFSLVVVAIIILSVVPIAVEWLKHHREKRNPSLNLKFVCPHCQTTGTVWTQRVVRKKGVSGGKATGAILSGGLSLLFTGLSRKEKLTQAHCDNCGSTWEF